MAESSWGMDGGRTGALNDALALVTRRLRQARWLRHASRGLLVGVAVSLVAAVLVHFNFLPDWLPLEAVIPIALLLGISVGTVTAFARPIAAMDAARLAESRLGLKERLSSALEFERSASPATDPEAVLLRRLQQEDAAAHAQTLKPKEAIPIRIPWEAKADVVGLVLLALLLILPTLPMFIPPGMAIERLIVNKTGQKLAAKARLIEKQADAQHLEGTKRYAQQLQKLGQRMNQGHMDKKKAMVEMSKLSQKMKDEARRMAEANSGQGMGSKSLAQAGQQLSQALQSAAARAPGAGGKSANGQGPKSGASSKDGHQTDGKGAGGKSGGPDKSHGFNVPGAKGKNGEQNNEGNTSPAGTPEMQKAAQAMQQGNTQGLSEQLRALAKRAESGQLSPQEQGQAAQDLQKLADALKGTPMPETQKHSQAAADAMKRGDKQTAAAEMRKAADAADREQQQQQDQQGMQSAQQSLEGSQGEMASASSPGDITNSTESGSGGDGNGEGDGQGMGDGKGLNGKGKGKGKGNGSGDGEGEGNNNHLDSAHGKKGSGKGNGGSGGGGKSGGKPGDTGNGDVPHPIPGSKLDPDKNVRNGRIYLGRPQNAGPSKSGPMSKSSPGLSPGGPPTSKVPYYNYAAPAQKSAESAMDKEDIPPAYRNDVRKYFNSLQPK